MAELFICKTNINTGKKLKLVKKIFSGSDSIEHWNVDTKDCDCVLRMVCSKNSFEYIVSQLALEGIEVTELPD